MKPGKLRWGVSLVAVSLLVLLLPANAMTVPVQNLTGSAITCSPQKTNPYLRFQWTTQAPSLAEKLIPDQSCPDSKQVQKLVDAVWSLVCNPVAASGPQSAASPGCDTLDSLLAYVHGLTDNPCSGKPCTAPCDSGTGYVVDGIRGCVTLGYTGLCNNPQVGVVVDGIYVCHTPGRTGPCDGSQTGYYVDGADGCFTLGGATGLCSGSKLGVIVDDVSFCVDEPSDCPSGQYGTGSFCLIPPPACPSGMVGFGPFCGNPAPGPCAATINLPYGCVYADVSGGRQRSAWQA